MRRSVVVFVDALERVPRQHPGLRRREDHEREEGPESKSSEQREKATRTWSRSTLGSSLLTRGSSQAECCAFSNAARCLARARAVPESVTAWAGTEGEQQPHRRVIIDRARYITPLEHDAAETIAAMAQRQSALGTRGVGRAHLLQRGRRRCCGASGDQPERFSIAESWPRSCGSIWPAWRGPRRRRLAELEVESSWCDG